MTQQHSAGLDKRTDADCGRHWPLAHWRPRWGDLFTVGALALLVGSRLGPADIMRTVFDVPLSPATELAVRHNVAHLLGVLEAPQRLSLVADASASMNERVPQSSTSVTKWEVVKLGITGFLRDLPERTVVGVRVFGETQQGCAPSTLLRTPAPLGADGTRAIVASLDQIQPIGDTPLAHTLESAAEDLGSLGGEILLLSDGMDTCVGLEGVCVTARALAARGIPIRIDVVRTFMPEEARQALACVPEATGGAAVDVVGAEPGALTALLFRMIPLRRGAAVLLIGLGWLAFFALCALLAEALGGLHICWGRAGFASDIVFALLAAGWATFWLLRVARLPVGLAFILVVGVLVFLYREIPRRRSRVPRGMGPAWGMRTEGS